MNAHPRRRAGGHDTALGGEGAAGNRKNGGSRNPTRRGNHAGRGVAGLNRNGNRSFRGRQRVVGEGLSSGIGADRKLPEEKRSVAIRRQAAGGHAEGDRSIGQRGAIAGNGDDQRLCQARAGQAGLVAAGGNGQRGGGAVEEVEWESIGGIGGAVAITVTQGGIRAARDLLPIRDSVAIGVGRRLGKCHAPHEGRRGIVTLAAIAPLAIEE